MEANVVPKPTPYFYVQPDGTLALTVEPSDLCVCPECPNLHVRVFPDATPENLRRFAEAICQLADRISEVQP